MIAEPLSLQKIAVFLSMAVFHAMIWPRLSTMVPKILFLLQDLLTSSNLVHLWPLLHSTMVPRILGLLQDLLSNINLVHLLHLLQFLKLLP
jgi:hypothetical protein